MGIAKSFENDVLFFKKSYERLKEFVQLNNRPPTRKENIGLYSFVAKLCLRYRQNPELVFWQWRVPLLEGIGIYIFGGSTITREPLAHNIEPLWRCTLNQIRTTIDDERRVQDLTWFSEVLSLYANRKGFLKQKRFNTLQELLIKWFQVGDIIPTECIRSEAPHSFRHTLS